MRQGDGLLVTEGLVIFIAMMGFSLGCGQTLTAPSGAREDVAQTAATVAQVAAAVTGQKATLADESKAGKNLGFDTHTYPGDKTMDTWKNTPGAKYTWVGYYLPSPCHKDGSWTGKRQFLEDMGWGIAVVYVGQQTWGLNPPALPPAEVDQLVKTGKSCNAALLGETRGIADGNDAVAVTQREGFAKQSVIFLDIERMEKVPESMRLYYRSWARAVLRSGEYLPGVYVHKFNAQTVYDDLKAEFLAAGVNEEPRIWVASGRDFAEGKAPQDVGYAFAGIWQGMIDVARAVANVKLPVDVNVSNWKSPSRPSGQAN
jgi:hypothetical protein